MELERAEDAQATMGAGSSCRRQGLQAAHLGRRIQRGQAHYLALQVDLIHFEVSIPA